MQSKKRDEKGLRVSENVSVCRDNQQVRNMPEQQHNEAENNIRRPVVFSLPVLRHDVQKGHETPFPYPRLQVDHTMEHISGVAALTKISIGKFCKKYCKSNVRSRSMKCKKKGLPER